MTFLSMGSEQARRQMADQVLSIQSRPSYPPCAQDAGHKFVFSNGVVLCERCGIRAKT